ncbi:hypothetical protein HDE_14394 [Halotydeus destructor]|nr:hypothetical protein HDE_14394 [Halotydeus destructor]
MNAATVFGNVDALLIFLGAKIYVKSKAIKYLNCSARVFVYASFMSKVLWLFISLNRMPMTIKVYTLTEIVSPVASHIFLTCKMSQVRQLMDEIVNMMTHKQRRQLKKLTVNCLTAYAISVGVLCTIEALKCLEMIREASVDQMFIGHVATAHFYHGIYIAITELNQCFFGKQTLILVGCIYSSVLYAWSMANTRLMKQIVTNEPLKIEQVVSSIRAKQRIQDLKERFESLFSIFPLLILSRVFVESSGLIIAGSYLGFAKPSSWSLVASYIADLLSALLVIKIATDVQGTETKWKSRVFRDWDIQLSLVENPRLVKKFCNTFKVATQLTAILFPLDKSVYLGFASSLVSFTIMFVQLP